MLNTLTKNKKLQNGKYEIHKVLGQGAFGITYLAKHSLLDMKVAIKELFLSDPRLYCTRGADGSTVNPNFNIDDFEKFKERFLNEATTLARFKDCPNIVNVSDIFSENDTVYFVMDYIEGKPLTKVVESSASGIPLFEAEKYIRNIANALDFVHKHNILHRDVKPDNILVKEDGTAVLIDFGIARSYAEGQTALQTTFHTPGYSPPEQKVLEAKRGAYTDVFALGGCFYFCLTKKAPQTSDDISINGFISARQLNPNIPQAIDELITKSLKQKREERYQAIDGFMNDLDAFYEIEEKQKHESQPHEDKTSVATVAEVKEKKEKDEKSEDEKSWEQALKRNKIEAYEIYLEKFSSGKFRKEAEEKIQTINQNKKKTKRIIPIISVILVVILAIITILFISNNKEKIAEEEFVENKLSESDINDYVLIIKYFTSKQYIDIVEKAIKNTKMEINKKSFKGFPETFVEKVGTEEALFYYQNTNTQKINIDTLGIRSNFILAVENWKSKMDEGKLEIRSVGEELFAIEKTSDKIIIDDQKGRNYSIDPDSDVTDDLLNKLEDNYLMKRKSPTPEYQILLRVGKVFFKGEKGFVNPLEISSANSVEVNHNNISVKTSENGYVKYIGGNNYEVLLKDSKTDHITISIYEKESPVLLFEKSFNVRSIPDPEISIGAKKEGSISRAEIRLARFIMARNISSESAESFRYDIRYKVLSFDLQILPKNADSINYLYSSFSARITDEMYKALGKLKQGDKFIIKNVKVSTYFYDEKKIKRIFSFNLI
jgi:serine/threonine protein kinase